MVNTMSVQETCLAGLMSKGVRLTRARKALVELLAQAGAPKSIPDMQASFKRLNISFHKTTLYREIDFLVAEGIVKEVIVSGEKCYYELVGEHHHHAVCLQCGDIQDILIQEDFSNIERELSRNSGFRVADHSVEFFGWCSTCTI